MKPYAPVITDATAAAKLIHAGRIVAFPTGTSYGLAADALQGLALQRLRNLKRRPSEKTFTVFMTDTLWPEHLSLTERETKLLATLAGQPLTLLVTPQASLAHLAHNNAIGLRLIDHPLMQALAAAAGVPLTATSANVAGQEACLSPTAVLQQFPGLIDSDETVYGEQGPAQGTTYDLSLGAILDGGTLPPAQPTTIAKIAGGEIEIIRQGALTKEDLTKAIQ
ncbi:MAG TPA: L-threonylcarbamoyladenylate synthase [Candidatus Andersenbacteria bacterium]|nr:L-threonylcarbamoyladenylate synthase [Candidatus Andersenbacteria bacterium]